MILIFKTKPRKYSVNARHNRCLKLFKRFIASPKRLFQRFLPPLLTPPTSFVENSLALTSTFDKRGEKRKNIFKFLFRE